LFCVCDFVLLAERGADNRPPVPAIVFLTKVNIISIVKLMNLLSSGTQDGLPLR